MKLVSALLALVIANLAVAAGEKPELPDGLYAEFVTPRGTIIAELFYRQVPLTVASFVGLAEGSLGPKPGRPFFNGLKFHRVVPHFVVQGGDPLGIGEGGPGYSFPDEFVPRLRHDTAGMLSMANDGPDTNGSQFFFTLREVNRLNYLHSVFGRVIQGREVLPQIRKDDVMTAVNILRLGAGAQAFRADQATFDRLAAQTRKFSGEAAPGPSAHFDDPDHLLPTDMPRALGFQRKLANFERATGRKIYARVYAHFAPEKPDEALGRDAETMAKRLHLTDDSILAVYFADTRQWALWFDERYLPQFVGRSGAAVKDAFRHDGQARAKEAFFTTADTRAVQAVADYAREISPGEPASPAQTLKLHIDAVLDALIFAFEPEPGTVAPH